MMLLDEDANMGLGPSKPVKVREVWVDNLESEFELIHGLVDEYPFVSMDIEFPDVVFKPQPSASLGHPSKRKPQQSDHYKYLKANIRPFRAYSAPVNPLRRLRELVGSDSHSQLARKGTPMKFPFHFRVGWLIVVLGIEGMIFEAVEVGDLISQWWWEGQCGC